MRTEKGAIAKAIRQSIALSNVRHFVTYNMGGYFYIYKSSAPANYPIVCTVLNGKVV